MEGGMIELGNDRIKYNQTMLIIMGILFLSMMYWFYYIYKTQNCLIILILSLLFIMVALFSNLRLYRIRVDKEYFYIENIFRKLKIGKNEFITVKVVSIMPYTLAITFTGGRRYLFVLNSSDSFKAMVSFNKKKMGNQVINKIELIINVETMLKKPNSHNN